VSTPHTVYVSTTVVSMADRGFTSFFHTRCGTRMYSSPEQTRKKSKLDGRSDIWSAGVMLYQMFSLLVDVPFDPVEIVINQTVVPPLSLHTVTPLSAHMHHIVMKALEVDPANRWASAEEMGDELAREEAALLDGIRTVQTKFQPHEVSTHSPSTTHSSPSPATTVAAPPSPTPASPPAAAAPSPSKRIPVEEIHPRYRQRRGGKMFAGGTADLPSKL
jgi:serine/threonine protein kinase